MFIIGMILIVAGVAILLKGDSETTGAEHQMSSVKTAGKWIVAIVIAAIGCYLTRYSPYLAMFGGGLLVLSMLRAIKSDQVSARMRAAGILVVVSAFFAVGAGLFNSPWRGEKEIEDRTDWVAPPIVDCSPQELLALEWSSNDKHSHWPVAKLMLDLCVIAYKDPVEARIDLADLGVQSETINGGSMIGYVVDFGDDAVVVFRGTETDDEYDILQDLRFLRSGSDDGGMHGGFKSGYDSLHSQVKQLLMRYEAKRVWISGHSLGGGLAVCCAHRLLNDRDYEIAGVMTFGQPMAVDRKMGKLLTSQLGDKYVFFVNDMDIVTRFVEPYVHFGEMVHWTEHDIERSKPVLLMGTGSNQGQAGSTRFYLETKTNDDLNALIEKLERDVEPVRDDGRIVTRGSVPSASDHQLTNYAKMLEALRTHTDVRQ
jgi:hypothetical protein